MRIREWLATVIVGSCVVAAASGVPLDTAQAAAVGTNGDIAVLESTVDSNCTSGVQLRVIHADGTGGRTIGAVQGKGVEWSPDGTKIAYTGSGGVRVVSASGTNDSLVAADGDFPTWSPDGTQIAYRGTVNGRSVIMRKPVAGGTAVQAVPVDPSTPFATGSTGDGGTWSASAVSDTQPAWSPISGRIAFLRQTHVDLYAADGTPFAADDHFDIYSADSSGGSIKQLSGDNAVRDDGTPDNHTDQLPTWSPGGGSVAFAFGRSNAAPNHYGNEIGVVPDSGGATQLGPIVYYPRNDRLVYPTYSPQGQLAYAANKDYSPAAQGPAYGVYVGSNPVYTAPHGICGLSWGRTPVANLTIAQVVTDPTTVTPASTLDVRVQLRNDTTSTITGIATGVTVTPSTVITATGSPTPASDDLAAGATTWVVQHVSTHAAGTATVQVTAHGTSNGNTITAQSRTRTFPVGAGVAATLTGPTTTPTVGTAFPVTLTVVNHSGAAQLVTPGALTGNPTTGFTTSAATPASVTLADGASKMFTYQVTTTHTGDLNISADVTAHPSTGADTVLHPTTTVTVSAAALEVTTSGDQALPDAALTDGVCDVDPKTDGLQCTLRAALTLANHRDTAQAITFAIPGNTTPTISPATPLPPATTPVSIDGTTQPGGWVVLSGAAASGAVDGLEVDGAASKVRGMVVNGFAQGAGIVAGGTAGGHVIAGNRVGTNLAGTAAIPNSVGILATAPHVTVGGTAGTAALACTGDCNLVSGNTVSQISNVRSSGDPALLAITVIGNWVGVDAAGQSALTSTDGSHGIKIAFSNPAASHAGDRVVIGGPSATAGRAPGNLVTGGADAILVVDETTIAGVPVGRSTVAGNLVGEDATGGRAIGTGTNGITVGGDGSSSVLIGGSGAGSRNVVGGESLMGIFVDGGAGTPVIGNRIGTDVTGSSAVPNHVGVYGGRLTGNLVSGNDVGIVLGHAHLDSGNLVGLDATGTRALPNNVGIGWPADEVPASPSVYLGTDPDPDRSVCSVSPCNVISGNTIAGIQLPEVAGGRFAALHLAGTYIGTDISGTRAVPNGVGVHASIKSFGDTQIGGGSRAASGQGCRYPCNVIAGNTGAGLALEATPLESTDTAHPEESGSVAGNYFGVGATGAALPNGGPQLSVTGVPGNAYLIVGGDITRGNFFAAGPAAGSPPALQIGGTAGNYPSVTAGSNRFHVPGPSAAITRPASSVNPPILSSVVAAGSSVTVRGSTNVAADPTAAPEQIELYAASSCGAAGTYAPIATGTAAVLTGDFSITFAARALAGTTGVYAIRTDQDHSTSRFSACRTGPRITTATQALAPGARELAVASNAGWSPGAYAQVTTTTGSVVRRVAALGSLIFAAPLASRVSRGATVVLVAPPRRDVTAPKVTVRKLPHRSVRRRSKLVVRLSCSDTHGVGVEHCPATVRLSTRKPGRHSLVVQVWDRNGNVRAVRLTWRVAR